MKNFLQPTKPKLISALILSLIFLQPSFLSGVFTVAFSPLIGIPLILFGQPVQGGSLRTGMVYNVVPPYTGAIYNITSPILFFVSNFLTWYLVSCIVVYLAATSKKK